MNTDDSNKIRKAFDECMARAISLVPSFVTYGGITLSFDDLGSRVIGHAFYCQREIKINTRFASSNPDIICTKVIPHEIAHHLTFFCHGGYVAPHGAQWKKFCIKLGGSGRVREKLENFPHVNVKRNAVKRWEYLHENGEVLRITKTKHEKVQTGRVLGWTSRTTRTTFRDYHFTGKIVNIQR